MLFLRHSLSLFPIPTIPWNGPTIPTISVKQTYKTVKRTYIKACNRPTILQFSRLDWRFFTLLTSDKPTFINLQQLIKQLATASSRLDQTKTRSHIGSLKEHQILHLEKTGEQKLEVFILNVLRGKCDGVRGSFWSVDAQQKQSIRL